MTSIKRKRCPNGTRKNKITGKCVKINKLLAKPSLAKKTQKNKCPPHKPLYNPKTNRCVFDTPANRIKLAHKPSVKPSVKKPVKSLIKLPQKQTQKKKCPPHKPLYNPKTNRCVLNTPANRIKINKINLQLNEKREDLVPVVKNKIEKRTNKNLLKTSLGTYEISNCNKSIFKDIDLNRIYSINDVKNNKFHLYYLDKDNKKINLNKKQFIAGGSFGKVFRIYDKDEKINIAIKTYNDQKDKEISVIRKLTDEKIDCNILGCKLFKYMNNNYISVCELYSDSMENTSVLKELSVKSKILIIKQVAKDLLCLYKKGFSYTDIKLPNTLYKCLSNKQFKVTLGDVGSICFKNDYCTITSKPYEYRGKSVRGTDTAVVWGLAVMFLSMLHNRKFISKFHWSEIEYFNITQMNHYINYYINKLDSNIKNKKITDTLTLSCLLHRMLELNPSKRIGLERVVSKLNQYK